MRITIEKNSKKLELIDPANNIWAVRWNISSVDENYDSCEQKLFKGKPSLLAIKEAMIASANRLCSNSIVYDFVWNDIPVYLNFENQNNFTIAYNAANMDNSLLPITLKLGEAEDVRYVQFSSIEELNDFYTAMAKHISKCLSKCWEFKSNINLEEYK